MFRYIGWRRGASTYLLALALALVTTGLCPASASAEPGILPFKPGIAVGARMGRIKVDETVSGQALGLYGQVMIGRLGVMGEVGRTSYGSSDRVDTKVGGGLTIRLFSISDVSAFVRASTGLNRVSVFDRTLADQIYAAIGPGLDVLLTRNISITAEILIAARRTVRDNPDGVVTTVVLVPDTEELTHLRLGLALSF